MAQSNERGHEAPAWPIAIVATLGMSVSYVDRQTLAAIAPSVTKSLGIDNTRYGFLLSAFSIAYLIGAPLAGVLVDRLGARRGFAAAVLVWSVVASAHAFAFSFGALFLLRVLLGAAEAPSFPAAAQAVRHALPANRRSLAFGMLFTGSTLGALVAAKLSIGLEIRYGFRGAFVGTALIGLLWLPVWLWVSRGLRHTPPPAPATNAPRGEWRALLKSAPVLRAVVAVIGSAPGLMFALNWTAKYLVDGWHVPKENIANYLLVVPVLFDLGSVGFGGIASRREATRKVHRTHRDLLLVAMVLAALLVATPLATSPAEAIAILGISACGGGGIYAMVTADMLTRVPAHQTSSAGGLTAAAQSLAHIVAGPLVGWSIERTHGHATALVVLGLVVIPTTIAFVAWPRLD